jgi:hypothetical protein
MIEIIFTDEFGEWFDMLSENEQGDIFDVVRKLEAKGVALEFPHCSAVQGASEPLRELRPRQGRSPLRPIYAFDPRRDAVLIIGGNKAGDPRFYRRLIPVAERVWREYLAEQTAGQHEDEE